MINGTLLVDKVLESLQGAGLLLRAKTRNDSDNGFRLRYKSGEIVVVLDNGTVCAQGHHQREVKALLKMLLGIHAK